MEQARQIFERRLEFDPGADFDAFLKQAPAKWTVYLLADERDQPVQLLCVKNLRASLKRRLGGEEMIGPSRKVNYREIIRRVHWRRVDSAFEADCVYLDAARELFPHTYRGMVGFRPAWFVHVNPQTAYPRYIKTINLSSQAGVYFGPLEDKHSAQRLVHLIENLFDLCRDYRIFTQSPNAGPCPWRQMGKCVGPCDGSISRDAYRQIIGFSADVLREPKRHIADQTQRMKEAAAELDFEAAGKIKSYIEQLSQLGKGPLRHVRPLDEFAFLSLQRGPKAETAKVFLITPGQIEEMACLIAEPTGNSELLQRVLNRAMEGRRDRIDEVATERIGVVTHHLFQARQKQGVFIPLGDLEERAFVKGYRELLNQMAPEESEGEGVTKELQAL